MSVSDTHPDYDKYLPLWQRCADAVAGQQALHDAGVKYLPKLADEESDAYTARLCRSDYFNATWRTIAGLSGMAFRKPPARSLPAAIEAFADDITLSGVGLDDFARDLTEDVLEFGRMGLLVDHPPMANVQGLTVADSEALGLRPCVKVYEARHAINWRYRRVRNAWTLVMVVLSEEAEIGEDEFSHKCETHYRVLDLDEAGQYRQRVFKVEDGKDVLLEGPIYPAMNGRKLDRLPFRFVGAGGKGDAIDEPPLIDLVDANIAHYQVNSDYRHGLHFTGLPTAIVTGYQKEAGEKLYIGSKAAWVFPDPTAKAFYLEFTGQGLGALKEALTGLEQRMAILGARMIADESRQVETLGATQIKRAGENGVLASIVIACSGALEWALDIMAQWSGVSGDVEYQINREFNVAGLSSNDLTALLANVQAGKISDREYYELLQRSDIIDSQKPYDEHQTEVDAMPAMPRPVIEQEAA